MSHKTFFISDTHFGHERILEFVDNNGALIRPFSSIEEMDELIVENWNKTVRNVDRIYHLGDVAMRRKNLPILERLNGKKVLVRGNHDIFRLKDYTPYFEDLRAYKVLPKHGIIFSHVPIHPESLTGKICLNAHGHLHQNTVDDPKYLNLCVEHTKYKPVDLDEVLDKFNKKG